MIRFEAIKTFANVLEYPLDMQGNWHIFFTNNNPITLELACGRGEYTVGLSRLYADRNFIGIDIKGNRIWKGASIAIEEKLTNAAFLRSHIDKLESYFNPGEVSEIWITFPDPQLRASRQKKRLTHPHFLRLYQQVLQPDGLVHLKTDSPHLYAFTKHVIESYNLELVQDISDVYAGSVSPELSIKTHYEKMDIAKSNRIHYLAFKVNKPLPQATEEQLKTWESEQEVNG